MEVSRRAMQEGFHFRAFGRDDLPELEQMVLALYQEDPPGEEMSREKIRRTVEELTLRADKGVILLFWAGRAVVGYAIVIHYWSNEYGGNVEVIDELYVKPPWRGKGIGTAFLGHLCAAGEGGGTKGLALEVTPANQRALAYYRRQGLRPAKNRHLFKKL
ncbi:MAG: GNAT family N-acetyltransferase [bacterium]